jgi:subtilisin family serine protease
VNVLFRHPTRYLAVHWTLTGILAAALLLPAVRPAPHRDATAGSAFTLITGQTVTLRSGSPLPAAGLVEGALFGSDQYALPTAVAPGNVRTPGHPGFFDAHLFDLTALAADGYDNTRSATIPVIVQFTDFAAARRAMAAGLVDGGIHLTGLFQYVPDAVGYVSKAGPFVPPVAPSGTGIAALYLDGLVHEVPSAGGAGEAGPLLNEALPLIGIDAARARGLTGKGIKVAIVDTGIDENHPDLKGRIVAEQDFSGDGTPHDQMGHGTHVAGIVGGTGALSDGQYGGVAPGVEFINAKALGRNGSGTIAGIMRAMEWAANQGARIENLSLGGGASDGTDPLSQEVNAITARKGVLFVIAAGNSGPRGKVSAPAAATSALAVGAIDKQRQLAPFSSQGPRLGDMAVKPEIVAPGVRITAPRANYGDNEPYVTYSGTSMATPMVAGAAALVMQLHPTWSPIKVKDALMNAASPIGDASNAVSVYMQGAGLVDLRNIVDQKLLIEPANLSFGVLTKNGERTMQVTLQNLSSQPLSFDLESSVRKTQSAGDPSLELSHTTISLPADQSLEVTVGVRSGTTTGTFGGELLAVQHGAVLARAPVGFTIR